MRKSVKSVYLLLLIILLGACLNDSNEGSLPQPTSTSGHVETPTPQIAATATTTSSPTDTAVATNPSAAAGGELLTQPSWPPPAQPYETLSRSPITADEQRTASELESNIPPDRNDIALAGIYRGVDTTVAQPTLVTEPLPVGTRQNITVNNVDSNTNSSPIFELKYVSDHAYFWFDTTEGFAEPTSSQLETMAAGFDEIYENSHIIFGPENSPGVDGDPRIHIVNTSPLNLCDVTLSSADQCYLAGYFSSHDLVPSAIDPTSNGREMFVMNGRGFGAPAYLDVLAHEFRHMIEENYDVNDWDWEVEGSAMLAEELLGFPGDGVARANSFLREPDQQLNRWSEDNTLPRYGQGYLFYLYIYNRLGLDLFREFAAHSQPAFIALDDIAHKYDLNFESGLDLWLDWLAALAIHDEQNRNDIYTLNDRINTANLETLSDPIDTTVYQYAADYYELEGGSQVTFLGSNHVPLLSVQPTSGSHMWLANRANFSSPTLIRSLDLTNVTSATLEYDVFRDIETGYDFGYVTLSTDGGQTWQPLAGSHMQGAAFEDDPSDSALTKQFYTGHAEDWVRETIDLTPYAGQEVQIRFEYITDPILTYGGLALDNIAVPEIGFFDDAETDTGWQADGFVRATGYIPQPWHLILITFEADRLQVKRIELENDNTAVIPISNNGRSPILIVAASAPMTLEPAYYQLSVNQ